VINHIYLMVPAQALGEFSPDLHGISTAAALNQWRTPNTNTDMLMVSAQLELINNMAADLLNGVV
jgi:hypothetical protein